MSYHNEQYPVAIRVLVTFPATASWESDTFEDRIKGLNVGHALYRARDNWSGAEIEYLGCDMDVHKPLRRV